MDLEQREELIVGLTEEGAPKEVAEWLVDRLLKKGVNSSCWKLVPPRLKGSWLTMRLDVRRGDEENLRKLFEEETGFSFEDLMAGNGGELEVV